MFDLSIDYEYVTTRITNFIRWYVEKAGVRGAVIGLSGGIDSTVAAYLLVRALGSEKVIGLILPEKNSTPKEDVEDAVTVAKALGIEYKVIDITPIVESFLSVLPKADKIVIGNVKVRVRMVILYYHANMYNMLVAGTSDKSELLIGYFTKYGDGASDITPISDLYKTQVRMLAKYLEVPEKIILKKSSPRLWPGHLAEEEIGLSYELLDQILYGLVDLRMDVEDVAKKLNIGRDLVARIRERIIKNEHKRRGPMGIQVSGRGYGVGYRIPHLT